MKIAPLNLPFWLLVKIYQKTFSHFVGRSCRYHPSCSHYALWHLENSSLTKALWHSTIRVLRCNPLFAGGIEYPTLPKLPSDPITSTKVQKILWWYVPNSNGYLLIKAL